MAIFNVQGVKLTPIREKDLGLEKEVQKLTEENLEVVFNLQFVRSEYALGSFRIDTLAFDREANAFVIVEYKKDKSFSVIDQGYAYLALMLNNKADFILEYNEKLKANLRKAEVDWSQSRVLFLAHSFTSYQQNAISFKDLPIELWEVRKFDNSTILYNQLLAPEAKESVKTITKNKTVESVAKEVRVYTIEDHIGKGSEEVRSLFETLQEKILAFGSDVNEVPKKQYIAYKTSTNFADIIIYSKEIRVTLNLRSGEIKDPKNVATDFTKPEKGHWGNGDYEIIIKSPSDLSYSLDLIEQAYQKSKTYYEERYRK
jgi:predicted transport protein